MSETRAFMLQLGERVSEVFGLLVAHLSEYDHEMLPHVLMGDVSRVAQRLASESERGSASAEGTLRRLLDELDHGMISSPESVKELIVVSFLENLDENDPGFAKLHRLFGPELRREWLTLGEA